MKVTVVIPTYKRPERLKEAIQSVFNQTELPMEILIGDDSPTDSTKIIIKQLQKLSPVPILYFHHKPYLGQSKNVDFLFQKVSSELLLLLHDDDLLLPECIERLKPPLQLYPNVIASFGNQYLIEENGDIIEGSDISLNNRYSRTSERIGLVNGLWAAVMQMFPNNAYLVRAEKAKKIGYYADDRGGDAVDFYFGFRLGQLGHPFYYVGSLVSMYRISSESVSNKKTNNHAYRVLKILSEELSSEQIEIPEFKQKILRLHIPVIRQSFKKGNYLLAIKFIMNIDFLRHLFSPKEIRRLCQKLL